MTPLKLTSWFRRRMIPLVVASSLVTVVAAPAAYHLMKRREMVAAARTQASRVAQVLRVEIEQRPTLWRYDSTKLSSRLAAEGLDRAASLVIHAGDGVDVPVRARPTEDPSRKGHPVAALTASCDGRWDDEACTVLLRARQARLLWGAAEAMLDGKVVARVWVGADPRALARGTLGMVALFLVLGIVLGVVLYALPMRAIARAEKRIHTLMGQLALTLQEEERRRIARDLHDGAGQAITAARLGLAALRRKGVEGGALTTIAQRLDEALDEVRRSTAALAPPALTELGLVGALQRHCEAFAAAARLEVECRLPSDLPALGLHVETACYRIVQEALVNTARHARAKRAWVRLALVGRRVELEVGDDGEGFRGQGSASGHGLDNIRERVRLLDGEVDVGTAAGVVIRIAIPIPDLGSSPEGDGPSASR